MNLAESISHALGGIRSGSGYRIPCICHGSSHKNLKLWHAPDGKLLAKCFSSDCSYHSIMQTLENEGLKEVDSFSPEKKEEYHYIKGRTQSYQELEIQLHMMLQYIQGRNTSRHLAADAEYMKQHPEHVAESMEPWEDELQLARDIIKNFKNAYSENKKMPRQKG